MWKKFNVIALAVLAFGFASAQSSSAGTEVWSLTAPPRRGTTTHHRPGRSIMLHHGWECSSTRPFLAFTGRGSVSATTDFSQDTIVIGGEPRGLRAVEAVRV
jgi:hypothetical protein